MTAHAFPASKAKLDALIKEARRRAKRRRVLIMGSALGAAALAISLFLAMGKPHGPNTIDRYVRSQAPLKFRGQGTWGSNRFYVKGDCCTRAGNLTVAYLRHRPFFTFGFPLHNDSPLPVRVERPINGSTRPFSIDRITTSMPPYGSFCSGGASCPAPSPLHVLRSFTLRSGGSRFLVIRLHVLSCRAAKLAHGASTTLDDIPLRYSYPDQLERTQFVQLPTPIVLRC